MKQIIPFLRLKPNKQLLLVKALFLMLIIRIMLVLLPFKYTQSFIKRLSKPGNTSQENYSIDELIWAVEIMCDYVPDATCLTKALTGQILFTKENYKPELKIGVLKNDKNQFKAHAWLILCGKTIIGQSNEKYTSLLELR